MIDLPEEMQTLATTIARSLMEAERPLVISGTGCGSESVIQAAANVACALTEKGRKAELCYVMPECNSLGLGLMGPRGMNEPLEDLRSGKATRS